MTSRPRFLTLLAVALTLLITAPSTAQEKDSQKAKETEQRQEFDKKTLALLNDVASAAWSLKLPENRLFVMSNTADLFWTFDEKRARNLYWEVLNSLNQLSPPVRTTGERLSKAESQKAVLAYMSTFTLRQKLLRQVARRDSQLALEMLRATRQVAPRPFTSEFQLPDDRQLEQEIASEVAARDPAQALQVARESLAKGLSFELLNLLYQLNEKDSEKASEFANEIIAKLDTTNVAKDFRASLIALQLLEGSRARNATLTTLGSAGTSRPLKLNDEQKRELVEVLTDAALSATANSNLLAEINDVMPEIDEFFPERRAALERKLSTFNETLTKQQRDQNTYNTLIRHGSAEEIVRVAASANEDERLHLYTQAAIIAVIRGTTDSFRDLVSKEVKSEGEQRKILEALDAEEISSAAYRKQIDRLKELLPKIRRKEERARAMAEVALLLKEKGEDTEAATLLDEAATLIKADLKSETQSNALLTLLCAYAVVDPPKAFALAERTIDQANSQISLLLLVDKVIKSGGVKKSEIVLEYPGIMPLDYMVFRYGKGVAALAKADFNRTRALAERFERNELRVLARLLIVKGIVTAQVSHDAKTALMFR
ncbi:MAG TPA: hypothetical protein VJ656_01845 [Pyrinomonadaceae bacterium]|nr:hypothetical protein [Pyrinomonadaceae bacterium]